MHCSVDRRAKEFLSLASSSASSFKLPVGSHTSLIKSRYMHCANRHPERSRGKECLSCRPTSHLSIPYECSWRPVLKWATVNPCGSRFRLSRRWLAKTGRGDPCATLDEPGSSGVRPSSSTSTMWGGCDGSRSYTLSACLMYRCLQRCTASVLPAIAVLLRRNRYGDF